MAAKKDPTESIRLKASKYPQVDQGTACTQSAFKTGGKAFLYIGMQGGRYKAMFKLGRSASEATRLAKKEPDRFEVGSTSWVTARFTAEEPMPRNLWQKWLDESYELSASGAKTSGKKKAAHKKAAPKTAAKKKASRKAGKKKAARRKAAKTAAAKKR